MKTWLLNLYFTQAHYDISRLRDALSFTMPDLGLKPKVFYTKEKNYQMDVVLEAGLEVHLEKRPQLTTSVKKGFLLVSGHLKPMTSQRSDLHT